MKSKQRKCKKSLQKQCFYATVRSTMTETLPPDRKKRNTRRRKAEAPLTPEQKEILKKWGNKFQQSKLEFGRWLALNMLDENIPNKNKSPQDH